MIRNLSAAAVCLFLVGLAQAQTPPANMDDVFHFTSSQTQQNLQEAATIVRTVATVPQVSIDGEHATLTYQGPAASVLMARWILTQLDTPGNESSVLEYRSPSADDVVRVDFLANVGQAQPMQEMLTVLRTVADIARVFNYTARRAMVIRAKSADMAFAEWLVEQLNLPADAKLDATPRVYPGVTPNMGRFAAVARVNYLTNISGPQTTQEVLTILRMVGDIAKVFNYTSLHALAIRASESDMARAEWLIQELNEPPGPGAGTQVYQTPGADDITRIFFLTNATPQGLQAALTAIRTELNIRHTFSMTKPAAIVVRGTASQIEAAVQIMAQRNGLAD
jgi:type II secretory pathway component GspD/PulD (secretin)